MNDQANELVEEVTDLLMDNGCAITKAAMIELAIFIVKREKAAIESVRV